MDVCVQACVCVFECVCSFARLRVCVVFRSCLYGCFRVSLVVGVRVKRLVHVSCSLRVYVCVYMYVCVYVCECVCVSVYVFQIIPY